MKKFRINNGKIFNVRSYDASYKWSDYVSLRDVAFALSGTEKQFALSVDGKNIAIELGKPCVPCGCECGPDEDITLESEDHDEEAFMTIDGNEVQYDVNFIGGNLYMRLPAVAFAFDLNAKYDSSLEVIDVDTAKGLAIDINRLDNSGYFAYLNGTVLGDATTGQIFYSCKADTKVAIASTTKIMTYLLMKEAIDAGDISADDQVTISAHAASQAASEDGVVTTMKEGMKVPLSELASALLVVSSNESAIAIAEHISGSEENFARLMNRTAASLGIMSAEFYNSNGLPLFTPGIFASEIHNSMSAVDLFKLTSHVLNKYPEIQEITSQKYIDLPVLGFKGSNTSRLLFNMKGITGIKTGTTGRAGCCLVASKPMMVSGSEHIMVSIILGAQNSEERNGKAGILLKYAERFADK